MHSIKKIVYILTVTLSLIIVTLIFTNFAMRNIFTYIDETEVINHDISDYLDGLNLPIRVAINISEQEVNDDLEKKDTLSNALTQNLDTLKKDIDLTSINLEQILDKQNENFIISTGFIDYLQFQNEIQTMITQLSFINDSISIIEGRNILSNEDYLKPLEETYLELLDVFEAYNNKHLVYSSEIRFSFMNFFNIILIILFLTIIGLILIIFRFIHTDLNLIKKTYEQIEHHDFDANKVLNKPIFSEEVLIQKTIKTYFNNQKAIDYFTQLVSKNYLIDDIIDHLLEITNELLGVDRVGIAFYDKKTDTLTAEYGIANYEPLYLNVGYRVNLKYSSLKNIIINKTGFINNDLLLSSKKKPDSESLNLIIKEKISSNLTIPLISENEVFGIVFFSSKKNNHFTQSNYDFTENLIYQLTGILNRAYIMKVFLVKMTNSFARIVDKKDIETGDHLLRMVKYSVIIAQSLQNLNVNSHSIDNKMILEIERNAAIHDIGKVGTPDYILKKPGKLTEEEFQIMKLHASIGGDIFKELNNEFVQFNFDFYKTAENIARYHHEKWDGTGYPEKRKQFDIPLESRIVALGDVFDAITSKRIYKEAWSFEYSVEFIKSQRGKHFDPIIVDAFMNAISEIKEVYINR